SANTSPTTTAGTKRRETRNTLRREPSSPMGGGPDKANPKANRVVIQAIAPISERLAIRRMPVLSRSLAPTLLASRPIQNATPKMAGVATRYETELGRKSGVASSWTDLSGHKQTQGGLDPP